MNINIKKIQQAVKKEIYFRQHAIEKMAERDINENDVEYVILNGKIIEEYPEDKYGPTCLIYSKTQSNRNLHVLVSYTTPIWVITTYEPNENKWINFEKRR